MKIKPGKIAPPFTTLDLQGCEVDLESYRGRKVMLSFYRYAACPFCNLRINNLIKQHAAWQEKGLEMLAVFQSPKEKMMKYVGRQEAPFPIIADPKRALYRLYGLETSWWGLMKGLMRLSELRETLRKGFLKLDIDGRMAMLPADFLINEDMEVVLAYYGRDIGDHLPVETIEQWIAGNDSMSESMNQ
ncbi:MAG: redoxin domain-containing protein [Saprospiraceae bacterium]